MRCPGIRWLVNYFLIFSCAAVTGLTASAQIKPQTQPQNQDDVIRVDTTLVQTDVMVFDKKGLFVDGLRPEQFALKIDNKPQPIAFFERVGSGSLREDSRAQAKTSAAAANAGLVARCSGLRCRIS